MDITACVGDSSVRIHSKGVSIRTRAGYIEFHGETPDVARAANDAIRAMRMAVNEYDRHIAALAAGRREPSER